MSYTLGVDVGGTFTDLQLLHDGSGELLEAKVPTTTDDPARGVVAGMTRILRDNGLDAREVTQVVHGTTVVTNSLLERTFSPAGLVLTKGYRALLEYARVNVPGPFGEWLIHIPQARPVPLENVAEAPERLNHRGEVLKALDEEAIRQIAEDYREREINSVGVSLLWSFLDPTHEQRIRALFAEEHPGCDVLLSSDVLPEIQEYERAVTTALSAALKPQVAVYLERLEGEVARAAASARVYCMKSSGGAISARGAREQPMELALSGPAGGVLGMRDICEDLGFPRAITFDMGGTSTDISFIDEMQPALATDGQVNHYPVRVPMVDIHTIGAGGGSIAWISAGGRPRIGPQSAGADPGPAAYNRGGTDATVTDANVVLGRFPTDLLGGAMKLDLDHAEAAVSRWGRALGLDSTEAALTIVELAVHEMELAIQEVSTRKGRDPRECVLVAFGGAGPAHASRLAHLLQIPIVLCPHAPGVASTLGLISADIRRDFVQSLVLSLDEENALATANETFERLRSRAWMGLQEEGVSDDRRQVTLTADFRYARQQYSVGAIVFDRTSDWERLIGVNDLQDAVRRFHETHKRLCGFDYRSDGLAGVELVNLRVAAIGAKPKARQQMIGEGSGDAQAALKGTRPVCFDGTDGFVETPIYARAKLAQGNAIAGPAIIEEFDSTTVLWPRQSASVDNRANIIISTGADTK